MLLNIQWEIKDKIYAILNWSLYWKNLNVIIEWRKVWNELKRMDWKIINYVNKLFIEHDYIFPVNSLKEILKFYLQNFVTFLANKF